MNAAKKILFRVDAGGKVGLGHYYRSLNLASALSERGHIVVFLHQPSVFWSTQKDFPYKHYSLSLDSSEQDMLSICASENADIFYVDGILPFTPQFILEIKKRAKVVFYQNLSDSRYLADVFILPSIHQTEDFFLPFQDSGTTVYSGLAYFTFNKEIEKYTPNSFTEESKIQKIAVIAGGSDPRNLLHTLYEMLDEEVLLENFKFTFYYGNDYMHKDTIPADLKKNTSFTLYDVDGILSHDVLIAAFGVSAYEFMCLGMPVIGIGHQKSNADALRIVAEKTGAIYDMGEIDDMNKERFNTTLVTLFQKKRELVKMIQRATEILDKHGVSRVANILECL